MKKILGRCGTDSVKFGAPLLAAIVVTAGAHLSTPPEPPAIRQASSPYVLTATVDTSSTAAGIAESDFYYMSADDLASAMDSLDSLGVTQIRILVPWRNIEATEGEYDWSSLDTVIAAAAERGIAVTACVTSTPTWASDYGYTVANGEPSDYTDYASFVSALATRYGASANDGNQLISAYEIWNEPNGYLGWSPTPSAQDYTELLKAAYTAIKAADPEATVVGGVVGSGVSLGTDTINAVDFIEQMYAAGAADYFDALSIHPYGLASEFSAGTGTVDSAIEQVEAIRALMDANGDTDKLIWATEYGMPTSGSYTEAMQSEFLQDFLEAWSTLSGVGPMFIYSLVDQNTGDGNIEDNWGLYTDDWTAKDAAAVLAAWLAANPTLAEAAYTPVFPTETDDGNAYTRFVKNLQQFIVSIKATIGTTFGAAWAQLTSIKVIATAVANSLSTAVGNVQTSITTALNSVVSAVTTALSAAKASTTSTTTGTTATTALAATAKSATVASAVTAEADITAAETTTVAETSTTSATSAVSASSAASETSAVSAVAQAESTDTVAASATEEKAATTTETTTTDTAKESGTSGSTDTSSTAKAGDTDPASDTTTASTSTKAPKPPKKTKRTKPAEATADESTSSTASTTAPRRTGPSTEPRAATHRQPEASEAHSSESTSTSHESAD
ncbi:beta-galactosidase [Mycolicibacterium fluoranthenivorans]|uniref:Beta-galactosidase n=1 Tax=Mycolicibacterium fluoranthenivorans TaxID=258505 RepID=A0A1G4W2Z0_9MYCO|nr:beta-galactosidase [Mycolicibacterium fluoranthenivorans]SCX15838.1 Beta-galactosidase [Mycolicibacterium fluoranthenivorans]